MPGSSTVLAPPRIVPVLPRPLDRRFEAIIFDWDGTAAGSRRDDARQVRQLVEALSAAAVDVWSRSRGPWFVAFVGTGQ